jgi:uncharacterized protein (TIGR00730 family)
MALDAVGVFCGSSLGTDPRHHALAVELGTALAGAGTTLVYGGGAVGLMGTVADAVLAAGGEVVGVLPKGLFGREVAHAGATELIEVATMHERKALMYERAAGFVGLPGGYGTLEEVAEVTTWSQLGIHAKPVVLLDAGGFWDGLLALFDRMVADGFLKQANRSLVSRATTVDDALALLEQPPPPYTEKWLDPAT